MQQHHEVATLQDLQSSMLRPTITWFSIYSYALYHILVVYDQCNGQPDDLLCILYVFLLEISHDIATY